MTTIAAALLGARRVLANAGIETAALDARLLLAASTDLDMAALLARDDEEVPALAEATFDAQIQRRLRHEPVARILGEREFWGLSFLVNADTLVPRPETETLVEAVLAETKRRAMPPGLRICDLGTGCGAVIVALLREMPEASGVAADISQAALETARLNAELLGVADRITFREADFAEVLDGPFDIIVSNPPYIRSSVIAELAAEVGDYDPRLALDGGEDGLSAYRAITHRAPLLLSAAGFLALEVGFDQSRAVAALCAGEGLRDVDVRADLAGVERVIVASMKVAGNGHHDPKNTWKDQDKGLASSCEPGLSQDFGNPSSGI